MAITTTMSNTYTARYSDYIGLAFKFAKQIVEACNIKSKFEMLYDNYDGTGEDTESLLITTEATGTAVYSSGSAPIVWTSVGSNNPTGSKWYVMKSDRKVFSFHVFFKEIKKTATSLDGAMKTAEKIAVALLDTVNKWKNTQFATMLETAYNANKTVCPLGTASTYGLKTATGAVTTFTAATDNASALAIVKTIKNITSDMREGQRMQAQLISGSGLCPCAEQIVVMLPTSVKNAIETYAKTSAFHLEPLDLGADIIIEENKHRDTTTFASTPVITIADRRFFKVRDDGSHYSEREYPELDYKDIFYNCDIQFGYDPNYSAVMLKQA